MKIDVPVCTPPKTKAKNKFIFEKKPVISGECRGCGICAKYCPEGAITIQKGKKTIDYDLCKGCGICARVCPFKAIEMVRR